MPQTNLEFELGDKELIPVLLAIFSILFILYSEVQFTLPIMPLIKIYELNYNLFFLSLCKKVFQNLKPNSSFDSYLPHNQVSLIVYFVTNQNNI